MGLTKRIEKVRPRGNNTMDFRTRSEPLLKIEGWYEASPGRIPERYQSLLEAHRVSGSNLKVTRWLTRNRPDLPVADLAEVGKIIASEKLSFKFSCRLNDLLRASETDHFSACTAEGKIYDRVPFTYLLDPDMAIAYIADKAGNFVWRMLFRLMSAHGKPVLAAYRPYGNGPTEGILTKLSQLLPIYTLPKSRGWPYPHNREIILSGYSYLTNTSACRIAFCDHEFWIQGKGLIYKEDTYSFSWRTAFRRSRPLANVKKQVIPKEWTAAEPLSASSSNTKLFRVLGARIYTRGIRYNPEDPNLKLMSW